jgi:HlyD family secretion protein
VKVLEPDELLKPDMNATVSFLAPRASSQPSASVSAPAIRVPASAVRDGAVFVVENGRAVKRPVDVLKGGAGAEVQIRAGLIGGEDLIVSPPETLQDGAKVRAQETRS